MSDPPPAPIPCVGAVVHDIDGRLLLVQRRNPPSAGLWSLPGGRVELGESAAEAVRRELQEETGLDVEVGPLLGTVEITDPDRPGVRYRVEDHRAVPRGRTVLRAGDDALAARWVDRAALARLPLVPGLLDTLDEWGVLAAMPDRLTGH